MTGGKLMGGEDEEQDGQLGGVEPNAQEELAHLKEIQGCMDAGLEDLESAQTHLFETVKLLRRYGYLQNDDLLELMVKLLCGMRELAEIRNAY